MRKLAFILFAALATIPAFAQKDAFAGFYKGKITLADGSELKKGYPFSMYSELFAEVYRGPDENYRLRIQPDIMSRAENAAIAENLKASGGKIAFKTSGEIALKGEITPDGITADGTYANQKIKLDFKRLDFKSPTMGAKAPAGAAVLFDGANASDEWVLVADEKIPFNWIIEEGAMTVKTDALKPDGKRLSTSIRTKKAFGKSKLHIEFRIPPMYDKLGQARANSGVFFGPYEVQVLDSFGTEALWNECGSLYRQTPPQVNACLEPGAWQTYDIYYTPAKYDGDKLAAYPTFTVYLNGVRVQNGTEVPYSTSIARKEADKFVHPKTPVQLQLQDHTNPVSFRNIWIEEIK